MSTEVRPKDIAAFLRDVYEATTRHQRTVPEQTKDGFVHWCADARALDGVGSPVLEHPENPLVKFLEVPKPGPKPGPPPVEPQKPPSGADGQVDEDLLQRYEVEHQRYEVALGHYQRELNRWQRHRSLYDNLFAARNPPDSLELVVALGLLAGRNDQGELRRHLAVAPAEVELDRVSGKLTVEVVDAVRQEVNWVPGEVRKRLTEDEGGLNDLVEGESISHTDAGCRKIIASFGTSGVVLESPVANVQWGQYALGSHPAVMLRKKDTSALLQLLHDMAHDMAEGGYVSDPFRMIVDPRFEPGDREIQNDRAVLPLPANTDQRSMIERARVEPHMVIQGPPGTGKTHTIANLAAVLMAEGRRVLITAENEQALAEVQSKLPVAMRPLMLPMLRERGTGPLASSVNQLTSRAGSAKSDRDRHREVEARVKDLEALEVRIAAAEQRLTAVARADREERRFGDTVMPLAGHQVVLAGDGERMALVDRFLSRSGVGSASDAEAVLELFAVVDDSDERMRRFPLPEGLRTSADFAVWLQEHHGSLATLGTPGDFDYASLAPRTDELSHLVRMLHHLPPTAWSEIRRTDAEYESAADECALCATDIDHGVTVEPSSARSAAVTLVDVYLALDEDRFDRPVPELVEQHRQAVVNSQLSTVLGVFTDTSRAADLSRSAQAALDLLVRDQSGLLAEHVTELKHQGRSRFDPLIGEAEGLVEGARPPLGLPVQLSGSAPPPHELLRQAEGLRAHLASGGKLSRLIGTPRVVREAAALLEHVRIDGSEIDTPEEVERAVEYFTYRRSLSLIDTWAQQHQLVQPDGVDHRTWLTALVELPMKARQVLEAIDLVESLVAYPTGPRPDDPTEILQIALASVASELVVTLGPLAEVVSDGVFDLRIDGVPLRSRAEARRARAALQASAIRESHHKGLPSAWREQCNPLDADSDCLVEMLRVSSAAAAVPGPARTADLTSIAVQRIIDRAQVDARRAELMEDHAHVIGEMRRVLAGCVPKSPATSAIDEALAAENASDYHAAMEELTRERIKASRASRLAQAMTALEDAHPELIAAFRVGDDDAATALGSIEELQRLRDHRSAVQRWKEEVGSSEEIHNEISALHKQFRRLEETIAGLRCWSSAVDRIKKRRELNSALSALTIAVDKVPKTRTAKSYPARMRALRDATQAAAPAIPCWVMSIDRIAEVLGYPTGEDRFDVVIVDESSQAWFTASFLYAIADQVIVVGDDLQTSPAAQVLNEDDIRSVVEEHIVGHRLANQVGADLSLYDVAAVMTGPDVMVDHFRCVPEIIELSNRLSYEPKGKRLLPSRVREPGALNPVEQVQVRGVRVGSGANDIEAEALVERVARCHADPNYAGMDFGVVVVGTTPIAHLKKLRTLLLEVLGPTAMADRRLEVGTPSEFQGAERNVMFLSLLDAPTPGRRIRTWPHEHTGQNRRRVQQLNVAVSRARDQLWIFRSFSPHDLSPNDARGVILEASEAEFPSMESQLELCDSQFERDVVTALAGADPGIRIRTQVEAIGYLIDIVVEDAAGHRLAVECDGDRWHSSDEQIRKDLHRQRTLEDIGWVFERFLASEWYDDPAGLTRQIVDKLKTFSDAGTADEQPSRSALTRTHGDQAPEASATTVGGGDMTPEDAEESEEGDPSPSDDTGELYLEPIGEEPDAQLADDIDDDEWLFDDDEVDWEAEDEEFGIADGTPTDAPNMDSGVDVSASGQRRSSSEPDDGDGRRDDRPTESMSARDVNRRLAREVRKLGLQPHGDPWKAAKKELAAGVTFAEAAKAALSGTEGRASDRYEMFKCESCGTQWTRPIVRGRKPRFCPDCR